MYKLQKTAAFILSLLGMTFCFAQENKSQLLIQQADSLLKIEEYTSANKHYEEAGTLFKEKKDWVNYFNSQINHAKSIGGAKADATETARHLQAAIKEHGEFLEADSTLVVLNKRLGIHHYLQNNFKEAAICFSQTLAIAYQVFPAGHYYIENSLQNAANSYMRDGDYQSAIKKWEQRLKFHQKYQAGNKTALASMYSSIAENYRKLGDYLLSKNYYEQALKIYQAEETAPTQIAELHTHLGVLFVNMEQYQNAQVNFQSAVDLYEQVNDVEGIANGYNNLGLVYLGKEVALDSAFMAFKNSLAAYKKMGNPSKIALSYSNLGITAKVTNNYPKATQYLLKSLELSQNTFGEHSPNSSIIFQNLAEVASLQGKNEQALRYYQKAISCHVPDFKPTDLYDNPDLLKMGVLGDPAELLDQLNLKGKLLGQMADANQDTHNLHKKALKCYVAADQLIDKVRRQQQIKGSKLIWLVTTHRIYEAAIAKSVDLATLTADQEFLEQAFYFIEKSKSILLLESLLNNKAKKFAGLPNELQEKEAENKRQLHKAEQALFEQKQLGKSTEKLKQEIFELEQRAIAINKELEQNHPRYYRMKYNTAPVTAKTAQSKLGANQAMLQYFVGEKKLYLLVLTSDSLAFYGMEVPENLPAKVEGFRSLIYGYFIDEAMKNVDYNYVAKQYAQKGYELYQELFPKIALPQKLIIIPDGVLGYLPFDALLTSMPENPTKFKSHDYLLRQHQISYLYSATLLEEMGRTRKVANKGVLAFAPSFGDANPAKVAGNRGELGPLFYNQEEVRRIGEITRGKQLLGKQATEAVFLELSAGYQVLHFATHGKANDQEPDFSYLAFAEIKDSVENEFLYANDLYNIQLSADLAVLSACETGIGRLYQGEGVASLARGFAYAGVPAIITTLWSVNDAKTTEIMTAFYAHLKQGKPKDAALQEARLAYLAHSDHNHAHPFFWAAPIAIGNMSPLKLEGNSWTGKWLWLLAILGIGLLFFLRNKKAQG